MIREMKRMKNVKLSTHQCDVVDIPSSDILQGDIDDVVIDDTPPPPAVPVAAAPATSAYAMDAYESESEDLFRSQTMDEEDEEDAATAPDMLDFQVQHVAIQVDESMQHGPAAADFLNASIQHGPAAADFLHAAMQHGSVTADMVESAMQTEPMEFNVGSAAAPTLNNCSSIAVNYNYNYYR